MSGQAWGYRLDRWHDQQGPLHLLRDDGSPACGCRYYTTGGAVPDAEASGAAKCKRCESVDLSKVPASVRLAARNAESMLNLQMGVLEDSINDWARAGDTPEGRAFLRLAYVQVQSIRRDWATNIKAMRAVPSRALVVAAIEHAYDNLFSMLP